MSKYLFTLLMIAPFLSKGQFVKGDKFIGGNFRISSQAPTQSSPGFPTRIKGFSIDPFMGFLINEKLALGGGVGYSFYNSKYEEPLNDREYSSKGILTRIIARRYFNISEKFFFSIDGNLNFNRGKESEIYGSFEIITQNYQLAAVLVPTFLFFPSPQWGFEASIGALSYRYSRNLSTDVDKRYFDMSYGSLQLGLSYYFRKKN